MPIIQVTDDWFELPQATDILWLTQNQVLRGEELVLANYFWTLRALCSAGF